MRKRTRAIRNTVFALLCCTAAALAGQSAFVPPIVSHADTQSDLAQKIKDADDKLKELDQKIAAAGTDIESNKDLCSCAEVFWVQKVLKRIRMW